MKTWIIPVSGLLAVLCVGRAPAAPPCCIPGDANGDLTIDPLDVPVFVGALMDPGGADSGALCSSDLNRDGSVDGADVAGFVAVLVQPDAGLFDYGPPRANAEAEQIGLETLGPAGPLLLDDPTYDRIVTDQALIRADTPALANEPHSMAWAPDQLIVKVLLGLPRDAYQCLNVFYRVMDEQFMFTSGGGDWYVLTFAGKANVEALGRIYRTAPEVELADPNGLIGGANFWTPSPQLGGVWRWEIDDGFMDCFDGCDCHRLYVYETTADGVATLLSFQEVGFSWCPF